MRRLVLAAALLAAVVAVPLANAQAPVAEWLFDDDVDGFACSDPAAQLTSTNDGNIVREEDNGVLELSYTPVKDNIQALVGPAPGGLGGGKSLFTHIRTSTQTIVLVGLNEADGSSYNTAFTSLADRWQEVALDFSEFALGDDSSDENGQLDPDQVQTVLVADAVVMLAMMSEQIPFLVAPDMSPRMLWLDDVWVGSEGVDPRWTEVDINGAKGVRVESFESAPLQWVCLAGQGIEIAYDDEYKADGNYSLRLAYDLPPNKVFAAMTGLSGVPLEGTTRFSLSYMTEVETTLLIEIEETDGSKYQTMLPLTVGDGFAEISLAFAELALGNDSTDENGQLDPAQAKQITIGDLSAMTGNPVPVNTLWIDDLLFME